MMRELRDLHSVVRRVDPDVVHLHSAKAGLVGRLLIRGSTPTVFQPHAWSFEAVEGTLRAAALRWEAFASRWTSVVIAVSEAEAAAGVSAGVTAPTRVCPNGVDTQRFTPRKRELARTSLGLPSAPLVLCMGRVTQQKGQDLLIRAWPRVLAQRPDARLLVVGDGPDREQLQRVAHGNELIPGATDVPELWYAAADVVALPSRWEGMALVPLEAMASARSVVAFDVPGVRECLVTDRGTAGAVVASEDLDAFVEALALRLSHDGLADREGMSGRRTTLATFDLKKTTQQVSRVVLDLAESPRVR